MRIYTVTMAKEKEINRYYDGEYIEVKTLDVEVEAESVEEAVEAVNGYKKMIAWKVDDEIVY